MSDLDIIVVYGGQTTSVGPEQKPFDTSKDKNEEKDEELLNTGNSVAFKVPDEKNIQKLNETDKYFLIENEGLLLTQTNYGKMGIPVSKTEADDSYRTNRFLLDQLTSIFIFEIFNKNWIECKIDNSKFLWRSSHSMIAHDNNLIIVGGVSDEGFIQCSYDVVTIKRKGNKKKAMIEVSLGPKPDIIKLDEDKHNPEHLQSLMVKYLIKSPVNEIQEGFRSFAPIPCSGIESQKVRLEIANKFRKKILNSKIHYSYVSSKLSKHLDAKEEGSLLVPIKKKKY